MKRIIFSSLAAVMLTLSAFASEDPDYRVRKNFEKEFAGATDLKWTSTQGYSRAVFMLSGQRLEAWFDAEGQYLGSVRDILYNQLPLAVMRSLDRKYPGGFAMEIREITRPGGTVYSMIIERNQKKYRLQVSPEGFFDNVEKLKS